MGSYFFNTFWFEPGSRMAGVWDARTRFDTGDELVAFAHKIELGRDQDGSVESDFLGAHLPFHSGGFQGVGPDGHPWAVLLQVAPVSAAALVGSANPFWPMVDGMDRALHYNREASSQLERGWTRDELLDVYAEQGVDPSVVEDWTVTELLHGLLAECCYVPLEQIVAGRVTQCAFPDLDHDCEHDVFQDVFAVWSTGRLNPDEAAQPSADDEVVGSLRDLLKALGCSSLQEVENLANSVVEPWAYVKAVGRSACEGIEVQILPRGTELAYPFTVGEFWSVLNDLEEEYDAHSACARLADQIETVEGFPVWVGVSYDCDPDKVKPGQRRRELDSNVVVQFPDDYPYRRRMSDKATIADWVAQRFERHFYGLEVDLLPPGDQLALTATLASLRETATSPHEGPTEEGTTGMKMVKILKLDPNGELKEVTVHPTSLGIQVGGYIEPVAGITRVSGTTQRISMIVNDDQTDGHLEPNPLATAMVLGLTGFPQTLSGTALFVGDYDENYGSLTDQTIRQIRKLWAQVWSQLSP